MKPKVERLVRIGYVGTSLTPKVAYIRVRRKKTLVLELPLSTSAGRSGYWGSNWDGSDDIICMNDDIRITCTSKKVKWEARFIAADGAYVLRSDKSVATLRRNP